LHRFVALALGMLALAACTGYQKSTRHDAGAIVFGRNKDAITLDPAVSSDGISLTTTYLIYEGLTRYKPGTFEVEPSLATSWEADADGTRWRFHLRRGVRFQDGTVFNAQAAKFNFDRWRDPHNPYHAWGYFTYFVSQFGDSPGIIAAVTVIDDLTLEIRLRRPLAPLLANLAMPAFAIASPTALQRERERYAQHPVGTGPYEFVEWMKDDHITLRRFEGYWGKRARVQTVVLRDIPDAATTQLLLESGELDGWEYPPPGVLPHIAANPSLRIYHQPPNNVMFLAMNNLHHPFDDARVRRAIGMAIDRATIVRHFWDPSAQPAREFLPEAVWPHGIAVALPYDPAAARTLLAQAGYPRGFHTSLWYTTAPRPYLPEPQRVAEAIQADLRAIGIRADLQGFEWGVYLPRVENAEHDMCLAGWTGDNGDPDNFLYVPLDKDNAQPPGAYNLAFWRNDEFHELVARAQRTVDRVARARLYAQALAVVRDQSPVVAIAHTRSPLIFRADIVGYVPAPDSMISFADLWYEAQGPPTSR